MPGELYQRLRAQLADVPDVGEIRMFGGVCFTLGGNMLCGTMKGGDLMFRVGPEQEAMALVRPGARAADMNGRPMRGFVIVSASGVSDDGSIGEWIAIATRFVGALPPKE